MRIQRIDNTHFGYNVQVNKKLVEKLKQSDPKDTTIETIAHMQKYCIETEELLETYYEGTGEEPEMLYALLQPKHVLADMVDRKFPELKYKDTEIKDYLNSKPVNKFDCTGEQKLQDMYEAHLKQTQNTYGQNPNNFKNRFEPQVF